MLICCTFFNIRDACLSSFYFLNGNADIFLLNSTFTKFIYYQECHLAQICFTSILVHLLVSPRHLFSPRLISQARQLSRPLFPDDAISASGISENAISYTKCPCPLIKTTDSITSLCTDYANQKI